MRLTILAISKNTAAHLTYFGSAFNKLGITADSTGNLHMRETIFAFVSVNKVERTAL